MEVLCTPCCKEKRTDAELLPALERYQSPRIQRVFEESQRRKLPMLILSGKYGLLPPEAPIPWYDLALRAEAVDGLLPRVIEQLREHEVTALRFYGPGPTEPGWAPYYAVLQRACAAAQVAESFSSDY